MYATSPLLSIDEIKSRLEKIFPEGLSDRNYVVRDTAAKIVFVMLYIDAIDGRDILLAPKQVYRMGDLQANRQDDSSRKQYQIDCMKPGYKPDGTRWYEDNTREPIRDESLRDGFVIKGAALVDQSVPTTSNKGRYTLQEHFAQLFILPDEQFEEAAIAWQSHYLSPPELARVRIMQDRHAAEGSISVTMPNGEVRLLSAGPSSPIVKAVIEEFAQRFLHKPSVLWLSESSKKVILQDDELMKSIGLHIDQKTLLPDLILADLGKDKVKLVFVEIVATDGPVTESRKQELIALTDKAGFPLDQISFITAFEHRAAQPLKKRFSGIAVDSLVWCMTEPDLLIWLGENKKAPFSRIEK